MDDGNPTSASGSLTAGGQIDVDARNDGFIVGAAVAGAVAAQDNDNREEIKNQFTLAVAFANNIIEDTVKAYVNNVDLSSGDDVSVGARFDPVLDALTIGGSIAAGKAKPMPGAVEFLNYAKSKGVEIFLNFHI